MQSAGARVVRDRVTAVRARGGRVCGVQLAGGGAGTIDGGAVVVAPGCWSGGIDGLPDSGGDAGRPVKGQLLRLRVPAGMPPAISPTGPAAGQGRDGDPGP